MTGRPYRILVTGSRNWRDRPAIAVGISDWLQAQGTSIGGAWPVPVIVHGAQRTWDRELQRWYGADWLADEVAVGWGFTPERHPAAWDRLGQRAGPIRNAHMVSLGADVCLAFPLGKSAGTRGCMALAADARIPVINLGDEVAP